jgi:hypothetical protein
MLLASFNTSSKLYTRMYFSTALIIPGSEFCEIFGEVNIG